MRNRVPDEATCAICGRQFDPSETRGWCPNPSCGEWQHPAFPVDETESDDEPSGESTASTGPSTPTKNCPNCDSEVRADANFCKHCAAQLSGDSDDTNEENDARAIECPDCGADLSQIPSDRLSQCPICMFDLDQMTDAAEAAGADTGTQSGSRPETNAGLGADDSTSTGFGSDADTDTGTGADTGTEFGTDSGTDTGTGFGTDSGTDTSTEFGTDSGTDTGTEFGDETGAGTGSDTGNEFGAGTGTGVGGETESNAQSGAVTECPNCGEDLTPIPPEMRTVCPGCRVDLAERGETGTGRESQTQAGADTANGTGSTALADVDDIASGYVQRLSEVDVTTVGDLQRTDPDTVSAKTGISARRIRGWVEDTSEDSGGGAEPTTAADPGLSELDGQTTRIQRSADDLVLDVMGQELTVTDGETVGREVRNAMVRAGAPEEEAVYVHRKHIRIEVDDEGFWLTRLGENSLTLNGRTVEKGDTVPIEDGDEVGFSNVVTATVSVR